MPDLARLRENEDALAAALLPEDADVTEPLEPRTQFLTHAYLVLACAVIEEFVEECFDAYVDIALAASEASVSPCFVPLATRFADDLKGQTSTIPSSTKACPMLRGLYTSKIVRPNNGIKRKNISALARPLGLLDDLEASCEDLLVPADTLGSRRGTVAHLGTVATELRPSDARKLVADVLDKLPLLTALLEQG
jgi:hypothetical protein